MKIGKNLKKATAALAAAVLLTGSVTVPVLAHGHGHGSCGGSRGTYCAYHDTAHRTGSNCSRYCAVHRTTHANGKVHHASHH